MKKPKSKKNKTQDADFDYMKTIKDNIKNVIRDPNILPKINTLVYNVNKIVIHAYHFLKFYCIHSYDTYKDVPLIDRKFIGYIFDVLAQRQKKCGGSHSKDVDTDAADRLTKKNISSFYNEHYIKTIKTFKHVEDIMYYDKLSYILAYEAKDIVTNVNINIQEHFIDHLYKYVNIVFEVEKKKQIIKCCPDKTKRTELYKELYAEIDQIKTDLTSFDAFVSKPIYHSWIIAQKAQLYPSTKTSFVKMTLCTI